VTGSQITKIAADRRSQVWRANGNGPPYLKLGRAVRYCWTDVSAWLEEQRIG
jgi:hypothetical protein